MGPWSATEGSRGHITAQAPPCGCASAARRSQPADPRLDALRFLSRAAAETVLSHPPTQCSLKAVVGMQSVRLATSARLSFRNVDPSCLRLDTAINERPRLCLRRATSWASKLERTPFPKYHVQGPSVAAGGNPYLSMVEHMVPAWWSVGSPTASDGAQLHAHLVAAGACLALCVTRDLCGSVPGMLGYQRTDSNSSRPDRQGTSVVPRLLMFAHLPAPEPVARSCREGNESRCCAICSGSTHPCPGWTSRAEQRPPLAVGCCS